MNRKNEKLCNFLGKNNQKVKTKTKKNKKIQLKQETEIKNLTLNSFVPSSVKPNQNEHDSKFKNITQQEILGLDRKAHQPKTSEYNYLTGTSDYQSDLIAGASTDRSTYLEWIKGGMCEEQIGLTLEGSSEIQAHPFRSTTMCVQNPDSSTDTPEEE